MGFVGFHLEGYSWAKGVEFCNEFVHCSVFSPPDRELVLELEAMRTMHGVCRKERSPSRLDAFVRSLEEERDRYRQEAEHYKKVRRPEGLSLSPNRSPGRGSSPRRGRVSVFVCVCVGGGGGPILIELG